MNVEVTVAQSCYVYFLSRLKLNILKAGVMAGISRRRGLITNTETKGDLFVLQATVPLSQMFGYATELRGLSSGQVRVFLNCFL